VSAVAAAVAAVLLLEVWLAPQWRRFTWPAASAGLALEHQGAAALVAAALAATQWWPERRAWHPVRVALARYWETVALMATATLGVLEALEAALPAGELGHDLEAVLTALAAGTAEPFTAWRARYPVPEAHQLARLIDRAWHDGLDPEAAFDEARAMQEALMAERRLALLKQPLYASVLPAALLFGLLLVILVPLGMDIAGTWLRL
jgi:hypothetical protein